MTNHVTRYEGTTREEVQARYQAHVWVMSESGWWPINDEWLDEAGMPVLVVTYEHRVQTQSGGSTLGHETQSEAKSQESSVTYDQESQYKQILPWIVAGEKLFAVFDCKGAGTGFVAITNKRLIFYDKAPLRKRKALMSVPFSKISAVGSVDQGRGLLGTTSELLVKTGSEEYDFEFRGGDKAQQAYKLIMHELLQEEKA